MIKKIKRLRISNAERTPLTKRQRAALLFVMVIVGTLAIVAAVIAIIAIPRVDTSQRGVGANGFRAYVDKGADLGIGKVVSKDDVVAVLGTKARSVEDADVSTVFNLNGDRGQTVTFDFTRADGKSASLYVDVMQFKSSASLKAARIYTETAKAGSVQNLQAYYMHAQTLGSLREYRLMVVNDLKAYKFVIDQPSNNITISEVSAVAALLKLAQKAHL